MSSLLLSRLVRSAKTLLAQPWKLFDSGKKSAPTTKKTQSRLQKWLQNILKESLSAEHKRCWDFFYIGLGRNIYHRSINLEISCAVLLVLPFPNIRRRVMRTGIYIYMHSDTQSNICINLGTQLRKAIFNRNKNNFTNGNGTIWKIVSRLEFLDARFV